jgi:3D (Asp-Asp-Asp) domain-containing protein
MKSLLRFALIPLLAIAGCTTTTDTRTSRAPAAQKRRVVRTTAYTHTESSGRHNALGQRLRSGKITSAAADWSRFPVGTRFRIVRTGAVYEIDDYGSALVGTTTIDLYKPSRRAMRAWGVRHVEIEILQWGSREESLRVLQPRTRTSYVRRMVENLRPSAKTPGH